MTDKPSKVLIIGSGPIIIGQAAEFDYSGSQACRALREEGIETVLVNSNPATIMTDEGIADIVYIEPLTVEVISRIIERERPDGLLPTLGGQTGLNLAVALADAGVLERFNVRLLGTSIETIRTAEDRELFKRPAAANRRAGAGQRDRHEHGGCRAGARAHRPAAGHPTCVHARRHRRWRRLHDGPVRAHRRGRPRRQPNHAGTRRNAVCSAGRKIEYEVMRDSADNCITVCNMENLDPMGVHTGDSIVVAPSQTLTDKEYQMLRTASLKIIRALKIEGGCNIQFALAPRPDVVPWAWPDGVEAAPCDRFDLPPYHVIEVNPRVSRSSALASKATGYPIARVAAKIAIGKTLDQIPNAVTRRTTAAFEPALDYCVVKIPRWPFDKFPFGDRRVGTQMKATGEVMAIDRSFEAALQKAVRSLEIGGRSLLWEDPNWSESPESRPLHPTDERLWSVMATLRRGVDPLEVSRRTGIDPWFTERLQNIVRMEHSAFGRAADARPPVRRQAHRFLG